MTDPIERVDAPAVPDESVPRKSANPLLWILVLLALVAAIWFFYNRTASNEAVEPAATTSTIGGDDQQAAANAEREQAEAAAARKAERRATARAEVAKPRMADRAAAPVAMIKPTYPAAALRAREEGTVTVRADIDASGAPANVTIVRHSGSRDLDRAAVEAIRTSHFNPAIEGGKAVASTVEVPVDFKLSEQ